MPDWTDKALILSTRRHAETSAIVKTLTSEHGLYNGVVRGVAGKTNRGVYQPGNTVLLTWKARLADQMGNFSAELITSSAALIMQDAARLNALTSACSLTEMLLPERAPYTALYNELAHLIEALSHEAQWQPVYCYFELCLLAATGYRLDLSACAATGETENLIYVSPRSGCAVSAEAGQPYKDKLLPLPAFLLEKEKNAAKPAEILDSLRLTGYFLRRWVLEPHGKSMPAARTRLVAQMVEEKKIPFPC